MNALILPEHHNTIIYLQKPIIQYNVTTRQILLIMPLHRLDIDNPECGNDSRKRKETQVNHNKNYYCNNWDNTARSRRIANIQLREIRACSTYRKIHIGERQRIAGGAYRRIDLT